MEIAMSLSTSSNHTDRDHEASFKFEIPLLVPACLLPLVIPLDAVHRAGIGAALLKIVGAKQLAESVILGYEGMSFVILGTVIIFLSNYASPPTRWPFRVAGAALIAVAITFTGPQMKSNILAYLKPPTTRQMLPKNAQTERDAQKQAEKEKREWERRFLEQRP